MEMNFILHLRRFDELSFGNLTPNAIAIYYHLFMTNNRCNWKEWFTEPDLWIEQAVSISRRETVLSAINLLKQKGFIDFERGTRKGQPTKYKILPLLNSAKDSGKDSAYNSGYDSSCDSDNLKHKYKPKNIDICASAFAQFWAAYPKRKDKEKAQKAFAKINPSQELLQVMLTAIEKSKSTDDWKKDNGQYIPYPATWLNGKRWEDEEAIITTTSCQYNFSDSDDDENFGVREGGANYEHTSGAAG